jgi:hypothetical protein
MPDDRLDRDVLISDQGNRYHRIVAEGEAHCNGHYGADHATEVITEREALERTDGPCRACIWPCQEMDEPPEKVPETAYITALPRRCRYYHTDRQCGRIVAKYDDDEEPRRPTLSEIQYHELTACPQCPDNEYEPPKLPMAADGGVEK